MPQRKVADNDPYAAMPDTTKTGRSHAPAAPDQDDPYATLGDSAFISSPREDAPQSPQGGPARRFLSSAYSALVGPAKGAYHAIADEPKTGVEQGIELSGPYGPAMVRVKRLLVDPQVSEAQKAREEFRHADPWSLHPSQEAVWHREKALGHGLATIIPGVGPWAASVGEKVGSQIGAGDVAGGMGTLAANAALYAAPEALGRVAKSELVSQTAPKWIVRRMIRPMASDVKFGRDPALAILEENITGNRLEDIGPRTVAKMNAVGKEIDAEALKPVNANKTVDLSGALKPLDNAMMEATKAGDKNLFNKLLDVKNELTYNWKPFRNARGEITLRPMGLRNLKVSPAEALQFKRQIGRRIRWTDNALDGEVNGTLADVYGQVKDALNKNMPQRFQDLNRRYGNLFAASKAIERRLPVEQRQAFASLIDIGLGASGHLPVAIASHVAKLPAVRTRAAAGLYSLPKVVPKRPGAVAAPLTGAAQSLQELQDEARRRRPTVAAAQ